MQIKYEDCKGVYSKLSFNQETGAFILKNTDGDELEYRLVLNLIPEYSPEEFITLELHNYSEYCTENSIYHVYVGEVRIGWIFPLQALFSIEHGYADNKHFLKYAYVATYILLDSLDVTVKYCPPEFVLEEFFEDSSQCMLVCDIKNCEKIPDFSISDYTVSLYKYGYSKLIGEPFELSNLQDESRRRVTLQPISNELRKEPFITTIFEQQIPQTSNQIIRFYYLYQIIEILIDNVFSHQFKGILSLLDKENRNLFEIKDKILTESGEKHRINLLFSDFISSINSSYRSDVKASCDTFLQKNGEDSKNSYIDSLYAVRCFLVHRLYGLDSDSLMLLEEVNTSLLAFLIEVLLNYKTPVDTQ